MPNENNKTYLGDAVYAEEERGMVKLTIDYGNGPVETIYLEDQVLAALDQYRETRKAYYDRLNQAEGN